MPASSKSELEYEASSSLVSHQCWSLAIMNWLLQNSAKAFQNSRVFKLFNNVVLPMDATG